MDVLSQSRKPELFGPNVGVSSLCDFGDVYGEASSSSDDVHEPHARRPSIRFQFENLLRRVTKTSPPVIPVHPEISMNEPNRLSHRRNLLEELQYLDELTFIYNSPSNSGVSIGETAKFSPDHNNRSIKTPSVESNARYFLFTLSTC